MSIARKVGLLGFSTEQSRSQARPTTERRLPAIYRACRTQPEYESNGAQLRSLAPFSYWFGPADMSDIIVEICLEAIIGTLAITKHSSMHESVYNSIY